MFVGAFGLVITFGLVNEYKDENMVDVDEIVSQINQPDDEKSESKLKPKIGN